MSRAVFNSSKQAPSVINDSETDVDGSIAEAELHKLQRHLRQLEAERKAYTEETRATLNRQSSAMDKLRRDNEFLTQELRLLKLQLEDDSRSGAKSLKAESLKQQIEQLHRKIKEATYEIQKYDKTIAENEKLVAKKRAAIGMTGSEVDLLKKQVSSMENRLDKFLVRFNKALETNGKLREKIDVLRHERRAFDGAYKKFEKEMMERKKQMNDIIQASTAAYESREEAQNRMIALKEKAEKEHQNYLQELKELERQIEQDKKLKEFMSIKNSERLDPVLHAKKMSEEQNKSKGSQEVLAEKYVSFDKDLAEIKKEFGTENIKEIIAKFSKMEDENFSLFNYVNELNHQTESLSDEIAKIERSIRKYSGDAESMNKKQQAKVQEIDHQITTAKSQYEKYNNQINTLTQNIEKVLSEVDKAYEFLGLPPVESDMKDPDELIASKLRAIELKSNELLMKNLISTLPKKFSSAAAATDKDGEGEADTMRDPVLVAAMIQSLQQGTASHEGLNINPIIGSGPAAPISPLKFDAKVLSGNDDSPDGEESNDFDDRPFTREELKKRTKKVVEKRISEKKMHELDMLISPHVSRKPQKLTNNK